MYQIRTTQIVVSAILAAGCMPNASAHYDDPSHSHLIPHAVAPAKSRTSKFSALILMPKAEASVSTTRIWVSGGMRYITADGLPDQPHGDFPNAGNPNVISEQRYNYQMPEHPVALVRSIPQHPHNFGIAVDGVPFDPGTAEFWRNDPNSGWHGEAMTAPPPRLGLDMNNAHVQPTGAYHYHGIPVSLLRRFGGASRPVLLGYAADGYPIYGPYGHSSDGTAGSGRTSLRASYRLKSGRRPGGNSGPGGSYDGTYTEDFEYVPGLGDLDECNGRSGRTAEYPNGTYYYVVTEGFPYIPRRWHAQPDQSFFKQRPGPGQGGPGGRGGRGGRPGEPGGFGEPGGRGGPGVPGGENDW